MKPTLHCPKCGTVAGAFSWTSWAQHEPKSGEFMGMVKIGPNINTITFDCHQCQSKVSIELERDELPERTPVSDPLPAGYSCPVCRASISEDQFFEHAGKRDFAATGTKEKVRFWCACGAITTATDRDWIDERKVSGSVTVIVDGPNGVRILKGQLR